MARPIARFVLVVASLCALRPDRAAAQAPSVTGILVDAVTGTPIAGATVRVTGHDRGPTRAAITTGRGTFRFDSLAVGSYRVEAAALGYAPAEGAATIPSEPIRIALERIYRLEEQVVTPDRGTGSSLAAPTALSVVPGDELRRDVTLGGPLERLQGLPGVDVAQRGLSQRTFAARGPSGLNSSALLLLSDFRPASLPSLRFNVPYLIPATDEDLERIEVVRGPASALYGPDADRGVIHLVSSSPLDRQGTSLSLAGGGRSTFQGTLRHASRLGSGLGLKLSGQYARGDDWPFADPRDVVARDPLLERGAVNARLDWAPTGNTRITVAGGLAQALRLVDQTDIGPIQLRDWQSSYLQTRVEAGRLSANLYLNANDAGGSFQLWSGVPVVDQSRALGAQIQYGGELGDRIGLRYGADFQRVVPRTGGTIHGANEDHDNITQAGVYAAATARLTPRLDLVGAVRADHHSRLDDFVVSPRIGAIFRPAPAHALRLTFNHATSTPLPVDLFLDLPLPPAGPFAIRGVGIAHAYTFRRDCGGDLGVCMRVPGLNDGNGTPLALPADATLLWQAVAQAEQFQAALAGIPAPTAAEVSSRLQVLERDGGARPIAPDELTDIPAARRAKTTTVEAGYRGQLGPRVTASLDLAHTRITNAGSSLTVQTPSVFLEPASLQAYLEAQGKTASEAAALAQAIAGLPLGTVAPEERPTSDILLMPRQGGTASFWSADLELGIVAAPWLTLTGNYSWVSEDLFPGLAGPADIALNAPRRQGMVAARLTEVQSRASLDLRTRWLASFPVLAGEYVGTVDSYSTTDLSLAAPVPGRPEITVSLGMTDLFGKPHRQFVGAPRIGRLILAGVRASF